MKKRNEEIVEKKGRIKELEYEIKHKLRLKDEEIQKMKTKLDTAEKKAMTQVQSEIEWNFPTLKY